MTSAAVEAVSATPATSNACNARAEGASVSPGRRPSKTQACNEPGGKNSVLLTAGIIIADVVGAGILSMPSAIANFGWLLGSILVVVLLSMNLHIAILMWRVRMHYHNSFTFVGLAENAFESAPVWQRRAVVGCTAVSQYTFLFALLGIYLLSVGRGLGMLFYNVHICLPKWMLVGIVMLLPFAGTARQMGSWQSLVYINVVSLLGTIFIPLCYLVFVGVEDTRLENSQVFAVSSLTASRSLNGLSTMTFAFTSQFMLVEIISEMKEPAKLPRAYGLIASPFMLVAFLMVGLGGYYYVGDKVSGMVTELLPFGPLLQAAAVCLVLHMLISYLIKGVVCCHAIQRNVSKEHSEHNGQRTRSWLSWNAIVVLVAGGAYLIANLVPFFSDLVDLLGASCTPMSCWVLPLLIFMRWYKDTPANTRIQVGYFEWALIVFEIALSVVLMIFGTYASLAEIMEHWRTYGYPFACHCEQLWDTCACSAEHIGMEELCPMSKTLMR